jgi:ABC-type transporter Mla subunit MlaD
MSPFQMTWPGWPDVVIPSAPISVPREAHDIYAISTLDAYIAAAQAGRVSESLGPLLALSILADKRGLAGEEIREAISSLARALATFGHRRAASELLSASIQAFVAGADHQSAADLAETLAILRLAR